MKAYRVLWTATAAALLLFGVLGAIILLRPSAWGAVSIVGAMFGFAAHDAMSEGRRPGGRRSARAYVEASMAAAAAGIAGAGLIAAAGVSGALAIGLLVVSAPRSVAWWLGRLHRLEGTHVPQAPTPVAVARLSDEALFTAWRRTGEQAVGPATVAERALLVQTRAVYLDELERRDAGGFERWLSAGAATSDPAPFIHSPGTARHDGPA